MKTSVPMRHFLQRQFAPLAGVCLLAAILAPGQVAAQSDPMASIGNFTLNTTSGSEFLTIYLNDGLKGNEWAELPYNPGTSFSIRNLSGTPDTVSSAGYQLSDTMIPLSDLNATDDPPSSFTPIPSLDGAYNTSDVTRRDAGVTPDAASTLALLGGAFSGLAALSRRLRRA